MNPEQAMKILKRNGPGVFLITRDVEQKCMVLWVHFPERGQIDILRYNIREEKTMLYLESSVLVFEDIFKLVAFYCVSRDVLPSPLKLPQAIAVARTYKDLETFSNLGTGFWDSSSTDKSFADTHQYKCCSNGDIQTCSAKSCQHKISEAKDNTCEIEISVGSERLWFVNPIFIEECSNAEAAEKLPHTRCVANSEIKTPKIVYRRPPPPPPLALQTPPLPSIPPSAPPPNYKRPSTLKTLIPHAPPPARPSSKKTPNVTPVLRSASSPPDPHAPCATQTPPSSYTLPLSNVSQNLNQSKGLLNTTTDICAEVSLVHGCDKMKINSLEDRKDGGDHNSDPVQEHDKKPAVFAPAVSKRRHSGKHPENKGNSMKTQEQLQKTVSPCSQSNMLVSKHQTETLVNSDKFKPEKNYVVVTDEHCISEDKMKKTAPLPPPRPKKHSRRLLAASTVQDNCSPVKDHNFLKHATSIETQQNFLFELNQSKNEEACCHKLQSKDLKDLGTSLSTTVNSSALSIANQEQDSLSTSSTEDDNIQEIITKAIVEAALCKCVLKPLKSPIEQYLQEIHTKDGSLRLLTENQLVIQDMTTTDLGVTTSVPETIVMEKIMQKFSIMHKTYSPEKKITYLLKSCKLIYDSMATGNPGKPHGADDFLPVLMYVLARCDLTELLQDVEYMMELMDPALQLGEGSYYLTTTYGALEHIKNYDKITVSRQLSLEVQDSIHRWERRRTLNKAKVSRSSIQDFITISFEELESKSRTLVIKPDTRVDLLLHDCAEKFEVSEPQKYGLFVLVNNHSMRLANDVLPHQVKSRLLKNEQKLDFHFLYKLITPKDNVVKELDII
ncbi:hypothetical protein GDO86_015911 [Hymenochirus boettgeri]|nr:hypothetical protein GDO86_015911 [Hymenochirus boettgeri]